MQINITLNEQDLKKLVIAHLSNVLNTAINENDVQIEVRSRQNYRNQDWEKGQFRARIVKGVHEER